MGEKFYHKFQEFFGFSRAPIMAMQIGARVKLLQLSRFGHKIKVDGYAIEPVLTNDPEGILNAVKTALITSKLKATKVCTALPYSKAITKIIKLPTKLKPQDIATEVEMELDKSIPYPVDAMSFDYITLQTPNDKKELEVLLAAARQQDILNITNIPRSASLNVIGIDIDAFAFIRAFKFFLQKSTKLDEIYVLFNIEETILTIVIFNDRILYLKECQITSNDDPLFIMLETYADISSDFIASIARVYLFGSRDENLLQFQAALEKEISSSIVVPNIAKDIELASDICVSTFAKNSLGLMQCYGLALGYDKNCRL